MKHNIRFIALALALGVVLAGCGTPKKAESPSKKSDKPAVVEKVKTEKNVTAEKSKPQTQAQNQPAPNAGLPLGSAQSPVSLDDILNPNGNNQAQSPIAGPPSAGSRPGPGPGMPPPPGQKPTPQQILAVMQGVYGSAKSLKVEGLTEMTVKQDGKIVRQEKTSKFSMLFKRPNLFVISGAEGRLSSDGKNVSQYVASAKRYAKSPMSNDVLRSLVVSKPGLGFIGLLMGMNYSQTISSFKPVREGKLGTNDMFILTMVLKSQPGTNAIQTIWIGKRDFGIYKNELIVKAKPVVPKGYKGKVPKLIETYMVSDILNFKLNPTLAKSAFKFQPPSGVKQFEKPKKIDLGGKPAPDFSFKWIDGSVKRLSDLRGKVVVLDIWALPMCEAHLPTLQGFYKDHKDNIELVAINLNIKVDAVNDYMKKKGLTFPYVLANEEISKVISEQYGIRSVPSIFIIDKQGIVKATMTGQPCLKEIEAKLIKLGLDK